MTIDIDLRVPCVQEPEDYAALRTVGDHLFIRVKDSQPPDTIACIQLSDESAEQLRDALTQWLERAR